MIFKNSDVYTKKTGHGKSLMMQPKGPLMIEHRLIMRMIALMGKEVIKIEKSNAINQQFITATIDFIQTYADRTHHGKEEEILFKNLANRNISIDDNRIMKELIQDHMFGREITADLIKSADDYQKGDNAVLPLIVRSLKTFVDFYPKHIEKEDKTFFPSVMTYLSDSEKQTMLEEFWEFDKKMIHERYKSILDNLETLVI
jgi:hemerythrin-like domain-containing protein